MNCTKCVSQKVCFMQKQIGSLASRMTQQPFMGEIETSAERTLVMSQQHQAKVEKSENVCSLLQGVIASNCSLYAEIAYSP